MTTVVSTSVKNRCTTAARIKLNTAHNDLEETYTSYYMKKGKIVFRAFLFPIIWEEENIYESFSEVGTATRQMYVKLWA
jgi:hypothetical protein